MTDSSSGEMQRSLDPTLSPDSENRDSRCVGKNESHYKKDILGDLGASPVNNVAASPGESASMEASNDGCDGPSSASNPEAIANGEAGRATADLISVVPGSVDGMNEYLMQHMRTLLNPLLVGGGGRHSAAHNTGHGAARPLGPPSSGGSSSDDENDVLVWRLPPTAAEARLLHDVAPASHDVSGDFIDIDMVTPSNHSMDGTSSMDEDPFGMMQNNLDGDDDDDDEGGGYEERHIEEGGNGEASLGGPGERLDPFLRRVEGHLAAELGPPEEARAVSLEFSRRSSGGGGGGGGGGAGEPFNNLSLNLLAEEREAAPPVKSQSSESNNHDRFGSRMNVTSSEEFSSPRSGQLHPTVSTSSTCSTNPPPTPLSASQAGQTCSSTSSFTNGRGGNGVDAADTSHCECANFLWSEALNTLPPYVGADEKVMLWSPQEVEEKRYFGLGDSSLSGPTALANVLSVFNLHHRISIRAIRNAAPCAPGPAAMVEEGVPLSRFLLSRCAAGCPASALVAAVSRLTEGAIRGFFLPLRAAVVATSGPGGAAPLCARWACLWRWLAGLLRAGVVPMVTLNCQQQGLAPIDWIVPPDWHHQMVYGVDQGGLYLTGPEEFLPGDMAMTQLVSENILLVRKSQILALWNKDADLWDLALQPDPKWESMNVLGQVVGTLRQSGHKNFRGFQPEWAHHVAVPTPTHAGLTLFVRSDPSCESAQHLCQRLQHLSDLLHSRLMSL